MTDSILVKGGYIIPVDGNRRIIKNGYVYVVDGKIEAVGKTSDSKTREFEHSADEVIDASGCVVTPGFIDTHVHLAQALLRSSVPDDIPLIPWLRDWVWIMQGVYDNEDGRASASLCILEMLRTGTTCFLEAGFHSRYGFDGIAEVVRQSGIRGILSKKFMDLTGYATEEQILPPGMIEDGQACIREFKEMHRRWAGADGRLDVWIGLRTPGAVSDELFLESAELAREYNAGITMHLAEVREDIEYFKSRGTTPSGFLEQRNLLGRKRVYAHCVWFNDDDIRLFAATGTAVAHCPSSNMKLGSGIAPIKEMLKAGVSVGLGCDGGPSNDAYDMIREMKTATLLQKVRHNAPLGFTAWDALEMATIGGARALGLENQIGSLEVGKKADVVIIDFRTPSVRPVTNPLSTLVYSATGMDVRDVIIDGRVVVRNKKVLTLDEEKIYEEADKHKERILEKAGKTKELEKIFSQI